MVYRVSTADIGLDDILPSNNLSNANDNILTLTDFIVREDKVGKPSSWYSHSSIEYDFVLNVDVEKAFQKKVVAIEVTLNNSGGKKFTSVIPLNKEIGSTIDKGENDTKAFLREVKKIRRMQTDFNEKIINKTKEISEGISFHADAGSQTSETTVKNLITQGKFNLDSALPGKINNKINENNPTLDFFIKPPKVISDGYNVVNGISFSKIKEDIIAKEIAEGKYEQNTMFSNVLTALEPDYTKSQSEENIKILKYSSTIIPIRRLFRIRTSSMSPTAKIYVSVRPILDDSIKTHASTVSRYEAILNHDFEKILVPAGVPDFIVTAQAPGYVSMIARKNDPTLLKGKIVIDYVNPTNPSQIIEPKEKIIEFTQSVVAFSMNGLHNVAPLIARATFYTMTPGDDIVRSKSTNLKPFKSSVSYMMPGVKNHNDSMFINAFSINQGVRVTLEGEIEGAYKVSLFREDLSLSKSDNMRLKKVFETLDIANNTFVDTSVVPGRVYRYYAEYTKKSSYKPFALLSNKDENRVRTPGQGMLGLTSHRSVNHATIKYKKSKKLSGLYADAPFIDLVNNRPVLNIVLKHDILKQNIGMQEILKKVQNPDANQEGNFSLSKEALLTKIPAVIIERINRVNQEEQMLGVVFLNEGEETLIKDKLLYSVGSDTLSMTGRYTYKFKLCQPTVGGLYNVEIPIVNRDTGLSKETYKVNALKYTSDRFTTSGVIENSSNNLDYVSLIQSFDTGERFYKNYDPYEFTTPPGSLSKSITLNVKAETNGYKLNWKTPSNLLEIVDFYLIYKTLGEKKSLVGSIKGSRYNRSYQYYDVNTYILSKFFIKKNASYSIVAVTRDGMMLPSTREVSPPLPIDSSIVEASKMLTKTNGVILV